MTIIVNPLYDSVFKFLMEDDRVVKILLSALLKKEVKNLQMRRREHSNLQKNRISFFRISVLFQNIFTGLFSHDVFYTYFCK